jgi:hypothetical protein
MDYHSAFYILFTNAKDGVNISKQPCISEATHS